MNRLGIQSLNAGAPDLRLSGDHTQRGTYTQRRRDQMAYGGIAGLDGRKRYWLGSAFQKWVKDPIEMMITGKNPTQIENESQARVDREENIVRDIPADFDPTTDRLADITPTDPGTGPYTPWYEQIFKGSPTNQDDALGINVGDIFGLGKEQYGKYTIPLGVGMWAHDYQKDYLAKQPKFPADETGIKFQTAQEAMADPTLRFKPEAQYANVAEGGRIGYDVGGPADQLEKALAEDDIAALEEPFSLPPLELLKLLEEIRAKKRRAYEQRQLGMTGIGAAQGGRIGYADGTPKIPEGFLEDFKRREYHEFLDKYRRRKEDYERRRDLAPTQEVAQGGRIGAQEGGLMDLGGMEKDYRQEGGFVPIGGEEKADDVPARLSKNEFVFTADAVRSAGGGDIDAGAQVMERLMENLEAGGKVSEESQGLEGAQEMFANTQRLQNRII